MLPLKTWRKHPSSPLPSFGGLQAILAIPCFAAALLQFLPLSSLCVHLCVSNSPPSPFKDTSHWTRAHPKPVWSYLNLITSAKNLCSKKVTFRCPEGVRTWANILGRHSYPHYSALVFFLLIWNSFTLHLLASLSHTYPSAQSERERDLIGLEEGRFLCHCVSHETCGSQELLH